MVNKQVEHALQNRVRLRPGVSENLLSKLIEAIRSRGVRRGRERDFVRLAERYLLQTTHSKIEFDSLIAAFEEAFPNRAAMPWEILPESGIDAEVWVDLEIKPLTIVSDTATMQFSIVIAAMQTVTGPPRFGSLTRLVLKRL
jgi:hypothetical protein